MFIYLHIFTRLPDVILSSCFSEVKIFPVRVNACGGEVVMVMVVVKIKNKSHVFVFDGSSSIM